MDPTELWLYGAVAISLIPTAMAVYVLLWRR